VYALVILPIAILVRAPEWWPRARGVAVPLAIAAIVGGLSILPIYLPYHRAAVQQHMTRPLEVVQDFSAAPSGYLATAARLHLSLWSGRFVNGAADPFFPGFVALGLAAAAIVMAVRGRRSKPDALGWRVAMLVAIGVTGVVLSLGTNTPIYGWMFTIFPPIRSLRAAARFGNLFLLAIAVLAGIGSSMVRRRWIAVALLVLVNVESLRAPIDYQPFTGVPAVYKLIADEPGRVVVADVPFWTRDAVFENAPYELGSTANWRPLMNGYSGYTPESYDRYAAAFWLFPADAAIGAMRAAGVTHIVVHTSRFNEDENRRIVALADTGVLDLIAISRGELRLYRLKP
jgi:hypothetical protein